MSQHDFDSAWNHAEGMVAVRWVGSSNLVHPKGENSMAMSGLGCGNPSVGVGEPFFFF